MTTLTEAVAKNIIIKLIKGQDYRIEVLSLINAAFLQYVIEFFKKIVAAKLNNESITIDWYKKEFLKTSLPSSEIAVNAGLNLKSISNMYNAANREVVLDASSKHYDQLYKAIQELVRSENRIDVTLTIKFKDVSVDLNISESLIVINTIAVKRAQLRVGLWSTAGKRIEKPLVLTLCKLFGVDHEYYEMKRAGEVVDTDFDFVREVDFYLVNPTNNTEYKCEVKLMGKGNPEGADAVIARGSKVFIADKLSDTNIKQLDSLGVEWVELRRSGGYKRFLTVLKNLGIPCGDFTGNIDDRLKEIFTEIFD